MTPLWVLNPNTTATMTEAVLAQVRQHVPPGFSAHGITASAGAAVIASRASFEAAAEALPALAARCGPGGGLLLACFGDPGLEALQRQQAPRPVVGLAEAAVAAAMAAGQRFAILTAGPAWTDLLTQRVADFGAAEALVGVYALPVDGAQLAADPEACRGLLHEAALAAARAGAQALVPGGAAFAGLHGLLPGTLPLIDPVAAATAALLRALR